MWIKICGNTNLSDAQMAVEGGANALGFIFAPSPRQVDAAAVRRITAELPQEVERYGVFVDGNFAEIVSTVTECRLTGVQLHRSSDPALASRLRQHFAQSSASLGILRVLSYDATKGELDEQLKEYRRGIAVDAVLVDSFSERAAGGTGARFDWPSARESFLRASPWLRLIVAGGLCPENVKEAIGTLRPWGVDVVSGVEAQPGKKDRGRVLAFIQAAREAAKENGFPPTEGTGRVQAGNLRRAKEEIGKE